MMKTSFKTIGLLAALVLALSSPLFSKVPDLTQEAQSVDRKLTYNLGATGLRGWIYTKAANNLDAAQGRTTLASRQILVTHVGAASPADGVILVDDVILGVDGKPFSDDARKSIALAIQEAETEARGGVLKLMVWRAGKVQDLTLKLAVMGTYSATAPWNCEKSKRILEGAIKVLEKEPLAPNWIGAIRGLALLATGKPEYLPKLRDFARGLAKENVDPDQKPSGPIWGKTWEMSYRLLFLCEYFMVTRDQEVLPSIEKSALLLARGQSMYGTFGHGFAALTKDGTFNGSVPPYGPVNMAGLPANLAIVLAKKCGVKHPEIDRAIIRASGFFGYFTDKGAIPYGEHEPWPYHENNGKNSITAVMFAAIGNKPRETEFFARMATAGFASREYGHTGQGFSYLWSALGAAVGGPETTAAFFRKSSWHLDLVRRSDGAFTYDGGEQYGPGRTDNNTYYGNSSYYGLSPAACYVLTYSLPLRKIVITGRDLNPSGWLNKTDAAAAAASGHFDLDRRGLSPSELVNAFGNWSPIVRSWAAEELATRPESKAMVPELIKLADTGKPHQIQGACEALGLIKNPEALTVLTKQLAHPDRWVRYKAAEAIKEMGGTAKPAIESILKALVATAEPSWPIRWEDPVQIAHGKLASAVFSGPLKDELKKVDPKLRNQAISVVSANPDGMARATLEYCFRNQLTEEDVIELAPVILAAVESPSPADTMFNNVIRMAGLKALTKYHFQEGIAAAVGLAKTQGGHGSESRTGEIMKIITGYGSAAKSHIPALKELIASFNAEVQRKEFPGGELNKRRVGAVEEAIKTIEAANEHPPLRSINKITMKPTVFLTAALLWVLSPFSFAKPLKVFILVGQSNMEGHAAISTFDYIGKDPLTAPILKEMRNPDGTPRVCDNVWVSYLTGPYDGSANGEGLGKLTAGFGARGDNPTKLGGKIGPEFTFGIYMEKGLKEKGLNEPILIIKTAWGGRSLNTEFRPPSAGQYKLPKEILEQWDKYPQGAHGIPKLEDRKAWQEKKDAASGVFYRMTIDHVKKVLADPKRVCPAYDPKEGYELAGFVWLQGFNDLVDGTTYPGPNKPGKYDLYSELLAHFIRDVRKDLSAPKMPFVIGVLGVGGESENEVFRKAMAAPANMPEFKGNVIAVETAPFWDQAIAAAEPKKGEYDKIVGTAHALKKDGTFDKEWKWENYWKPIGKPLPDERNWRFATVNATETKDKLEKYTDRRFRDIALPAGMEKWYMPDFDDSKWTEGKAPIGKGVWKHSGVTLDKYPSTWGEAEFLLMRTTFEVEDLNYESYRIAILARQGFHVYLNGHKIHTYIWWQDSPRYGSIVLNQDQIKHLKKGKNVLAVYANDQYDLKSPARYAGIDVRIEGITKADQEKLDLALEEVLSPKDREALKGASNGGYHYFGSAKIFAQMGKAFAEALLPLQK